MRLAALCIPASALSAGVQKSLVTAVSVNSSKMASSEGAVG